MRSHEEAESYWRDVGTIDAYWEANIDLTDVVPALDLFQHDWPIWTYAEMTPPAKFVHDVDGRRGIGVSSLVSGGCIVSGADLRHSLLFTGVHIHSYAHVTNAVVLPYVDIGRGRGSTTSSSTTACAFRPASSSARMPSSMRRASAAATRASASSRSR